MRKRKNIFKNLDFFSLLIVGILFSISFFFIYSACFDQKLGITTNNFYIKQGIWIGIGAVFFLITYLVDYRKIAKLSPLFYLLSIVLLILVQVIGQVRYGAQRWISIGGFVLQPSEITKIFIIIFLAKYLTNLHKHRNKLRFIFLPLIFMAIPLGLIITQPDLGTGLVCVPIIFTMLFVGGARLKYLFSIVLIAVMCMPFMWFKLHDYQKNRIRIFLNPQLDPLGAGYTAIQSKIAVGSGGLTGKGWCEGTQTQLNFIPEKHTDFIFSVIAEEKGFIGGLVVIVLFWLLILSTINAALQSSDMEGRLICTGIAVFFFVQVMINLGMTIGVMPITGVPLPFVSYGGSSFLTSMIAFALVQNVYSRRLS